MKNETKHTPLPWTYVRFADEESIAIIGPAGDERIAEMIGNQHEEANAAFIVRACNAHDEMLDLLKALSQEIKEGGIDKTSAYSLLIDRTVAKAEGK